MSVAFSPGAAGSKSARGPRESSLPGASEVVEGRTNAERVFSQSSTVMEPKWSEIAKYSKLMEEKEKVEKREKQRTAQETIRKHLDIQMAEKEQQKQALKEADTLLKQQQSAQLEQWNREQQSKKDAMSQKTQAIQRDRDEQTAILAKSREEEHKRKLEE